METLDVFSYYLAIVLFIIQWLFIFVVYCRETIRCSLANISFRGCNDGAGLHLA